jgi:phosphomevalonate kinase
MSSRAAVLAPGKAILCGEYAVLHGAPAIAVAVDRSVRARAGERGERTPFVEAALRRVGELLQRKQMPPAPAEVAVDSAALYDGGHKLGLGSSAAVTVAVVGAAWHAAGGSLDDRRTLLEVADEAHAEAQGARGSGVDVAASVYGGAIRFQRRAGVAEIGAVDLPDGVELTFIFAGRSASTPELIGRVKALAEKDPQRHDAAISRLVSLSHAFAAALDDADAAELVQAAASYGTAMRELGEAAGVEIVTRAVRELDAFARRHGGAAKPSGAGGGDLGVAFTVGAEATRALRDDLARARLAPLSISAPAPGLRLEMP